MSRKRDGAAADPRWRSHLEPAPGDLRIVQALVDTAGNGEGQDELSSPRALGDWLARWGLLRRGSELRPADLERVLEVRSGLVALIRAPRGDAPDPEAVERLDSAASAALLRVRFETGGGARLEPDAEGLDGVLAGLFEIVARAQRDGSWRRLKPCAQDDCRAVFFDHSGAGSAKWCSRRCGNKDSSRTYRKRRKQYRARVRREGHPQVA